MKEPAVLLGGVDDELNRVGAGVELRQVEAVVRAVGGVHRHEGALENGVAVGAEDLVVDLEARDEVADAVAEIIALDGGDVSLDVHRGVLGGGLDLGLHVDRLEVDAGDLQRAGEYVVAEGELVEAGVLAGRGGLAGLSVHFRGHLGLRVLGRACRKAGHQGESRNGRADGAK
ncbi:Uncharacterised protein [Chlamydia trachomatis]|nr:Uncharacterised protein [Chlamydia trachomatis]